jgi:hypothetical protein
MKQPRYETVFLDPAKWIGTGTGVLAASLIALNLGVEAYGFGLFLISSVLWTWAGWMHREASLVLLEATFTVINVVGLYRWIDL